MKELVIQERDIVKIKGHSDYFMILHTYYKRVPHHNQSNNTIVHTIFPMITIKSVKSGISVSVSLSDINRKYSLYRGQCRVSLINQTLTLPF